MLHIVFHIHTDILQGLTSIAVYASVPRQTCALSRALHTTVTYAILATTHWIAHAAVSTVATPTKPKSINPALRNKRGLLPLLHVGPYKFALQSSQAVPLKPGCKKKNPKSLIGCSIIVCLIQTEEEKGRKLTAHVQVPLPAIPSEQTPLLLQGVAADPGHSIDRLKDSFS